MVPDPRLYVSGSRSISLPASHPVRMRPLLLSIFPVIKYVDPDTVGASFVQMRFTVTFPVPDSAPL